jgi:uncharacterized membrane protein (UPF0182 family)
VTRDKRIQLTVVVVGLGLAVVGPSLATLYTDWLWFGETGYQSVFWTSLSTRLLLGSGAAAFAFLFVYVNLRLALRTLAEPYLVLGVALSDGRPLILQRRGISVLVGALSAVVAMVAGVFASSHWLELLQYRNATSFGERDPILGYEISFYVFNLPFLTFVESLLLTVVLITLIGTVLVYLLPGRAVLSRTGPFGTLRGASRHISLLSVALFLILAAGALLDTTQLLLGKSDVILGATYADVTTRRPVLWILAGVSVFGALLALAHAFATRTWLLVSAFGLYATAWLGGGLVTTAVQRLVVTPNEQVKETPFIEYNITATRRAFGLDSIEERQLSGDGILTPRDIATNTGTIGNIRLWDRRPLLDTFGQLQELRRYYDFASIDIDRYIINGQYRQVMLSARELNAESLPNRNWIAERLTFTHGYGLTLGPVNEVSPEGLPVLFVKNIPPESPPELDVKEPSLYFSELASDYVFVKTRAREFHYPRGDSDVYRAYDGTGGISVGSMFNKLLFALRFRSVKILLSEDLTPDSRVLFHRNIIERVKTIAPFLTLDRDPYLVIAGGRLYWMLDAYTSTSHYPYSTRTETGINYIRNSVKIVVDAYHGTTTFYLADRRDPLAATLAKIFPGLVRPLGDMPAELRRHVRYPEGLFSIQSAMYATYHMTNPAVFFNKEDQWEVPAIESGGTAAPMEPYYAIMRLPRERDIEFIEMLPFTPSRRDNLAAWLVARSDGSHYGRLVVFQFPKQKVVYGPRQIVARINQDQVISPQITLWNQQGSEVIQGTLLVVPIEESLLYIRPLYLRADGGKIPELKRIIVAYQNTIVMEPTLDAALERVFRKGASQAAVEEPPPADTDVLPAIESPETLAPLAREHYDKAMQAQRQGNWAVYGEEIKQVGAILEQMAKKPETADKTDKPKRPVKK